MEEEELNKSTSELIPPSTSFSRVEKPKRKIPIKKFVKQNVDNENDEKIEKTPLEVTSFCVAEIPKSFELPTESLGNKKARLAQYMRRGPLEELNPKGIDLVKLESMKENIITAQLESYDFYQNQKTTDVLSDTLLLWSSSGIDSFTGLEGKFTKKCQEDETLKNDISDELSVYGYLISRPVRIISRLCLNFFQALKEPRVEKKTLPRGGSIEEKNEKIEIVEEKN